MARETGTDKPQVPAMPTMVYKGHCIPASCEIEDIPGFKCRDDDIWVCSFPRSDWWTYIYIHLHNKVKDLRTRIAWVNGLETTPDNDSGYAADHNRRVRLQIFGLQEKKGTMLTQQIVYLIMTLDVEKGRTVQLDDRFPMADCVVPGYPYVRGLKHLDGLPETSPRFMKCHIPYDFLPDQLKSGKGKIVFITRNPKASVVSFHKLHSYMKIYDGPMRQYVEGFLDGKKVLGSPWDKHFRSYWEHRNDPNVLFIQFDILVKHRRAMIAKIAGFLGKDLSPAELDTVYQETTLESMKTNNAVNWTYFEEKFAVDKTHGGLINNGDDSVWRRDLPDDLVTRIDQLIEKATQCTDIVYE